VYTGYVVTVVCVEGLFTSYTRVCATDTYTRNTGSASYCAYFDDGYRHYSLLPGGNVTVHFQQLVVANVIVIRRLGFLTLCEVDVLGTKVVFAPEG